MAAVDVQVAEIQYPYEAGLARMRRRMVPEPRNVDAVGHIVQLPARHPPGAKTALEKGAVRNHGVRQTRHAGFHELQSQTLEAALMIIGD